MTRYLKLGEAARLIGVSEKTVRRAVKRGDLEARFFGGAYRIREDDLEAFVERAAVKAGAA